MSGLAIWLGLIVLVVLTFSSALGFALRVPTRSRLADAFEELGQEKQWESFKARSPQLVLSVAVVRAVSVLALLLVVLHAFEDPGAEQTELRRIAALAIASAVVLVLGIAIPSAWAKYAGEWLITRTLPVIYGVWIICYPIVRVLQLFDPLIRRLSGVPSNHKRDHDEALEQEVLDTVNKMSRHGAMDEEEKEMIESVIELRDTLVEHIMVPRTEMVAIPKDIKLDTLKELIRKKGHSRIPVYGETIDTILGVLYAKDLLHLKDDVPFDAAGTMRKALFIPESKKVKELLHEFQEKKLHIAVVLDEYGGTAGLVTIEDILEELVGEIFDEYETPILDGLKRIDDSTVEIDARMRVDDLNDELDICLPEDEDYETIGGFVFSTLGRIPKAGERCEHENVAIQVIDAEPRRIRRIRLHITPAKRNGHDE